MAKKKSKNSREVNINNTIKSILLSNREINPKNLKFSIFREILKSDKMNDIFIKRTGECRNLIIHYQNQINEDMELNAAKYYFDIVEKIRIDRVNDIVKAGKVNNVLINKMSNSLRNKEIEENWVDRGYTHIKISNGTVQVKIEDITQLNYQLKLLEVETIDNIITKRIIIDPKELENWIISVKNYAINTYGEKPKIIKNVIEIGLNNVKLEKCFLYYCLSDGKLHIISRTKFFDK